MSNFALSQIPVNPNFRDSSVNTVVVVPLLSQKDKADGSPGTNRSAQSFHELFASLRRHNYTAQSTAEGDLVLVVPNSTLTRPGDWRYSDTPLKSFHWQQGCQRLLWHDGRPHHSRRAHDKLYGNNSSRSWIDLYPHRRTAAIVGVLNMHDCSDANVLQLAIEELHQWALRYSMPPYQASAHGRSFERDTPVERLFVYDSFDDENQDLNLSQRKLGTSILAFPPSDEAHQQMMDLHMNVVISDLTVAIFRDLEAKIQESAEVFRVTRDRTTTMRNAISRYVSGNSGEALGSEDEPLSASSKNLGVGQLAGLVSPESKLAKDSPKQASIRSSGTSPSEFNFPPVTSTPNPKINRLETNEYMANRRITLSKLPQLMTPMDDDEHHATTPNAKDSEAIHKRDHARREKYTADLCLLAGSPLDAYERYLKAAESCKASADPLWYAVALEGCAAAHIAMAEAGGFSVDEYLENNFQMPEDIMAKAKDDVVKPQQRQPLKQTLPEVVFELCEEALNIVNRSPALVYLHTELLLKLASYCSEESEAHLRCRWGEGDACYAGESGDTPRWERTSVSKLSFNPLVTDNMGDMLSFNSYVRAKKVCNLLSRAVSIEGIDHATRVDVAIRGAQICLNGIKATHWPGRKSSRLRLQRKAAFFTVIAAEAATIEDNRDTEIMTRNLWQLALQLYSTKENEVLSEGSYGWAVLRAFCLDCIAHQSTSRDALDAVENLLSLLSTLEPTNGKIIHKELAQGSDDKGPSIQKPMKLVTDAVQRDAATIRATLNLEDVDLQQAVASASQFAKSLRSGYAGLQATSPGKWTYDCPVGSTIVPLSNESSLVTSLVSLSCAWGSTAQHNSSVKAQEQCVERLVTLQRAISTSSGRTGNIESGYPLYLVSCEPVETEAEDLECVRKRVRSEEGSMKTFYNPFEAKKSSSKKTSVRVPKDEERAIAVVFGNRFSLPLEVQRAQVRFKTGHKAVKAAALSFIVPPLASDFTVHFPFTIQTLDQHDENEVKRAELFEVAGLSLTCLGKSLFLSLKSPGATGEYTKKPAFGTPYPFRNTNKKKSDQGERTISEVEVFPCQPNLQVYSSETGSPVKVVTVPLSDGEVYTLPTFHLSNDLGPSMKASIECLDISVDGRSATKLYSSDQGRYELVDEEDFVRDLLYEPTPPPFKLRVVSCNLSLDKLNRQAVEGDTKCGFGVQIASAHNLGQQIVTETSAKLVFRYRGPCGSDTEVWRKKTILLRILHAKGPRLSSIALRPDFIKGCAFSELTASLTKDVTPRVTKEIRMTENEPTRLGMDDISSVCGENCVVVLTVTNETRSSLTISHAMKLPLGFPGNEASEMTVHPGVSAKIPLQLKRIARTDNPMSEIVSMTMLDWQMHKGTTQKGLMKARGRLRIPLPCLADIVARQPASLFHICQSPCTIELTVGGKLASGEATPLDAVVAKPVDVAATVTLNKWITEDVARDCGLAIEFRCVRQDRSPISRLDHVWTGVTHFADIDMKRNSFEHKKKLAICSTGTFVVSCCARLYQKSGCSVEVWWSEHSMPIRVADWYAQ